MSAREFTAAQPSILRCLEVSTAHITKEDCDLLIVLCSSRVEHSIWLTSVILGVIPHNYGYFIHAEDLDITDQRILHIQGYSEAMIDLLLLARKHKCHWLYLDSDGIVYDDLPQFDW